jgi:hypothetical protein
VSAPSGSLLGMAKQPRDELVSHLREQMGFLRRSAEAFDGGEESEAKRLAAILRLLLHNSKTSNSLLKQLGVQHQLRFLDTRRRPEPARSGIITRTWDAGLAVIELSNEGSRYKAPLTGTADSEIYGPQPFRQWWQRDIMEDLDGVRFTRQEFVLFMAHKVGGVHVDPDIQPHFKALTQLNSLGWGRIHEDDKPGVGVPAGNDQEPLGNPIPANVRQIAYEVQATVEEQMAHLLNS